MEDASHRFFPPKRAVPPLHYSCFCKYNFSSANSSKNPPQRSQMKDQLGLSKIIFVQKKWNSYRSHSWPEPCSDTTEISGIQLNRNLAAKSINIEITNKFLH
jgi:hypothetical protein